MKKVFLAMAMVLMMCQPVVAETNYNVCFNSLDADYDGEMSKGEFMVAFPSGDLKVFEAADGDKSGTVSHEEWETYKESVGLEERH